MNPKVYKYFGLILIILSIIVLIGWLTLKILLASGSVTDLIMVVFLFLTGKYYYKFGKKKKIDDRLIKTSIVLLSLSILFIILSFAVTFLSIFIDFSNPFGGFTSTTIFTAAIASLIYIIGIVFLILHIRKQKPKNNNKILKKR